MPTDIKLKNSVTATNAPSSLQQGEVAINITDKKVWVGNAATTPVLLLGSGADGTFTNLTVSGVSSFADGTVSAPSITNIGDTNTGMYFPAADTIAFTEGGVEVMRITSSGTIGINTNTPLGLLDVTGGDIVINSATQFRSLNLFEGGTRRAYLTYDSTNNFGQFMVEEAGAYVNFGTGGVERVRIDSNGNVGIGTTAPLGKFAVNNSGTGQVGFDAGTVSSPVRGNLWYDTDGSGWQFQIGKFQSGAFTAQMTFTDAGNVGIGTTSLTGLPSGVGSLIAAGVLGAGNVLASHQTNRGILQYGSNVTTLRSYGATSGTGQIAFNTGGGGGSADTEAMRIDSSGRITAPFQTGFKANKLSNSQSITGSTWTRVSFNNTATTGSFNTGNAYSTSTNLFTAPVTGKYLFTASVNISAGAAGNMYVDFGLNGSNNVGMEATVAYPAGDTSLIISTVINMAANDTMEVDLFTTNATTAGNRTCGFSGQLLS